MTRTVRVRAVGMAMVLALVSAACGDDDSAGGTTASTGGAQSSETTVASADPASGEPIRIGVVIPFSGPFAAFGPNIEAGLRLQLEQHGSEVAGRPIELIVEDEASEPAEAVTRVRKLIEEDDVSAVVCCVNGAAVLAVAPILEQAGIPLLNPLPTTTGLEEFDNAFVLGPHMAQLSEPFGTYAAEELGHQTAVLVASDFVVGRTAMEGFRNGFEAAGGEIVEELYPPLGTQDYGPFVTQIDDADMTFVFFAGADAVRFVQQYSEFGVKDRIPLYGVGTLISELVLGAEGPAATGVSGFFHYTSALETPGNEAFLAALDEDGGDIGANHGSAGGWMSADVIVRALEEIDGNAEDADALIAAIEGLEFDGVWGPLRFDPETHYAVVDGYLYDAVDEGGSIGHEILDTIPGLEP